MNKITLDISSHFGRDYAKLKDFLTLNRDEFMCKYINLTYTEYYNTILYCLNTLNMTEYVYTPICNINGRYIRKLCRNKGLDEFYLLTLCS